MRFVRTITGILLLAIGLPMLLAGGALWLVGRHRDAGGSFAANLEPVETAGYAVVVPDLDALLREDAPFARSGSVRLRITGGLADGPAFLGVAPAADVNGYLTGVPHARIDRVRVTRGALPARITPVQPGLPVGAAAPRDQLFWTGHGLGILDLAMTDLRDRKVSLVVMRPDARAGVGAELRAELRPGWFDLAMGAMLSGGSLLVLLGIAALIWPVRPREVVLVVEPRQLPALAGRLGVPALAEVGDDRRGTGRTGWIGRRNRPLRPVEPAAGRPPEERMPRPPEPVPQPPVGVANGTRGERPRSAKILVPGRLVEDSRPLPPWPELDFQARTRTAPVRRTGDRPTMDERPATLAEMPISATEMPASAAGAEAGREVGSAVGSEVGSEVGSAARPTARPETAGSMETAGLAPVPAPVAPVPVAPVPVASAHPVAVVPPRIRPAAPGGIGNDG